MNTKQKNNDRFMIEFKSMQINDTRAVNYLSGLISDIRPSLDFSIQQSANKSVIQMIHETLNVETELETMDPNEIKIGAFVAAKDIDSLWYRAQVIKFINKTTVQLRFIDFGNNGQSEIDNLMSIPFFLSTLEPQCSQYNLAFVSIPKIVEDEAFEVFKRLVCHKILLINHEFSETLADSSQNSAIRFDTESGSHLTALSNHDNNEPTAHNSNTTSNNNTTKIDYVSMVTTEDNIDVSSNLLKQGLAILNTQEVTFSNDSFNGLVNKYKDDEMIAKTQKVGYWDENYAPPGELSNNHNYNFNQSFAVRSSSSHRVENISNYFDNYTDNDSHDIEQEFNDYYNLINYSTGNEIDIPIENISVVDSKNSKQSSATQVQYSNGIINPKKYVFSNSGNNQNYVNSNNSCSVGAESFSSASQINGHINGNHTNNQ